MDDIFKLPDSKALEKMAEEYGRVRVKSFAEATDDTAVSALGEDDFDYFEHRETVDTVIALCTDGIAALRAAAKNAPAEVRAALYDVSATKRHSLEALSQITGGRVEATATRSYPAPKKTIVKNSVETLSTLSLLIDEAEGTTFSQSARSLFRAELVACLKIIGLSV